MTPGVLAILAGLVLLLPAAGPARAADAGAIMTGPPGSTSVRFGQDIAGLARRFGVALEVVPSPGGPANIEALTQRPGVLLAIVPSDTLDFLATFRDDPELRRRAELLQVAAPLHPEEVHVLARPGIATLADLRGKRVAVGAPDSGTLVTATLLLGVAGVAPAEELRLGDAEALAALRGGRVDAMVHVAGQPSPLLKDTVAIEDALHLVPVDQPALRELYPAAAIPAGTYYPWQPEAVPTVALQAVLVTLRWTSEEGATCRLVGKVARIVADNLGRLRSQGHPQVARGRVRGRRPRRLGAVAVRRAGAGRAGGLRPRGPRGGNHAPGHAVDLTRGRDGPASASRSAGRSCGPPRLLGGGEPCPSAAVRDPPGARGRAVSRPYRRSAVSSGTCQRMTW